MLRYRAFVYNNDAQFLSDEYGCWLFVFLPLLFSYGCSIDPIVNNFFEHNYHYRGMVKWQGFMLSDHMAALKKQTAKEQKQQIIEPKPQQTTEVIASTLAKTYHRKQIVSI